MVHYRIITKFLNYLFNLGACQNWSYTNSVNISIFYIYQWSQVDIQFIDVQYKDLLYLKIITFKVIYKKY